MQSMRRHNSAPPCKRTLHQFIIIILFLLLAFSASASTTLHQQQTTDSSIPSDIDLNNDIIISIGSFDREARGTGERITFKSISQVVQEEQSSVLKGKTIASVHAANFNALVTSTSGEVFGWGRYIAVYFNFKFII